MSADERDSPGVGRRAGWLLSGLAGAALAAPSAGGPLQYVILPEQRTFQVRDPAQLPHYPVPPLPPPRTVSEPRPGTEVWNLSLDEAVRIALVNARVVRVLTGITAQSSGSTIYDPAIANTHIDQAQGRFDPVFEQQNRFNRIEVPQPSFNPANPSQVTVGGDRIDEFQNTTRLSKTNVLGGQSAVSVTGSHQNFSGIDPVTLDPLNRGATELSYTQPLLQGGGFRVNMAPIVIARLDTERSYFQYKDSVQELVRGVIEAYWNLVQARTDAWARQIQLQQAEGAYNRERARLEARLANLSNVSQERVTYNQFRAALIQARAAVLNREAALRNLLYLPPGDGRQIVPVSDPTGQRFKPVWDALLRLAEERRPDVVELKLILEADQVRLAQAQNQNQPRLDAVSLYRWNGLSGQVFSGDRIASRGGQFTDWTLGINFSVPLGLRQARAALREQELLILRDRSNLEQGIHAAVHDVAQTVRDLDSFYEQYLAYKETREAALVNLRVQLEQFRAGRVIYLNVLQAINDWGNAVSSEALFLLNYNVALAALERKSGTILETHGLVFYEERLRAAGPLGIFGPGRCYPAALPPGGEPQRYPANPQQEPSENFFDLRNPAAGLRRSAPPSEELPPPRRVP